MSASYLHTARGNYNGVFEMLGNQPGVIPLDYGRDMLAGLHACEALGYTQAADGQLGWLFEQEKKLDGPILPSIIKANKGINLCRPTCARLGCRSRIDHDPGGVVRCCLARKSTRSIFVTRPTTSSPSITSATFASESTLFKRSTFVAGVTVA